MAPRRVVFGLRTHLVTLALGAFVPLLIFAVVMVVLFSREQRAVVNQGTRETARALALAVDREVERSIATLDALATSPELAPGRLVEFERRVRRVLPSQDGWSDVTVFDGAGRRMLALLPSAAAREEIDVQTVRRVAATARPSVSDLRAVADGRRHVVTAYVPVIRDGRIPYVLSAGFSPSAVGRVLTEQRLPDGWIGVVVDRRSIVLAGTRGLTTAIGRPAPRSLAQHADASLEGSFVGEAAGGGPMTTSFSRTPLAGWTVAVSVPDDALSRDLWQAVGGIAGFGLVLGLSGVGLALVLGRRVSRAMHELSAAARTVGEGGEPSAVHSPIREINAVARALEETGALLRRRADERDRYEAALRERDERLRLALTAGRMATWEWDLVTDHVTWSDNLGPLTRGRLGGGGGFADVVRKLVHPDDRVRVHEAVERAKKPGAVLDVEFRMRWSEDVVGWVALTGRAMHDAGGRPVRVVGVAGDVTARRRAEAEARQLAAIVESSSDAIVGQRLDGRIVTWNAGAERVYGWTAAEARGQSLSAVFPAETRDEHDRILARVRAGEFVRCGGERVRQDGARIEVAATMSPMRDATGRVVGAAMISRDVTEERRVERRLASLQTLADATLPLALEPLLDELLRRVCAVLACDVATVLLASDDGHELVVRASYGRPQDRGLRVAIGHGVSGRIAAARLPLVIADAGSIDDSPELRGSGLNSLLGVPLEAEERLIGVLHIASVSPRRYTEDDTRLLEVAAHRLAAAVERARLFEAERVARAEAEAANRTKDHFLATLSHELRTPLQSMLAWLRMLRSGRLDERTAAQALATVERNTLAQRQLINDLLDISRIVAGKLVVERVPVDVVEVVASAAATIQPSVDAAGLRLATDLPETAVTVSADPARLQQIALNLLSNAVKFTPAGGRIDVSLACVGREVVLRVRDTGKGIAPDMLVSVFDRFRQGDVGTRRAHGGLGLGLAIVRHLVESHGGSVSAESAGVGAGSTFSVRLPLLGGVRGGARPALAGPAAAAPGDLPSLTGVRVLVVEDEPDAREVVQEVLERCGAEVTAVASAGEALSALTARRPDVLVSDISMPDEDGYDLIRRVRASSDAGVAAIPAAALTALARAEDRAAAISAGYSQHVAKPVEPEQLARVVLDLSRSR